MYPNLYYAFKDLFGIEIGFLKMFQSFGFFVAIAFLLAAWTLSKELQRKTGEGLLKGIPLSRMRGKKPEWKDFLGTTVLGFLLGFKLGLILSDFDGFLSDTQGYILSAKGNFITGLLGAGLFIYLRHRDFKKEIQKFPEPQTVKEIIQPHELTGNILMYAAGFGLAGAKLFDALEQPSRFIDDPIGSLLSFSGLTMYGGLICGAAGVLWYTTKKGIPWRVMVDAAAPGLMLAYGVGRIGCQVAGDGDWGLVNLSPKPEALFFLPDWAWAYQYPGNVLEKGVEIPGCQGPYCFQLAQPVYPTPLYESVISIAMFFGLWLSRFSFKIPGLLFSVYLIMNGVERFFIEKIRVNAHYEIFGNQITQAEIISCLLIVLGVLGIYWLKYSGRAKS
jgi:phosphatidylglycerol---prolipoprotein diacylglyceryl transferase